MIGSMDAEREIDIASSNAYREAPNRTERRWRPVSRRVSAFILLGLFLAALAVCAASTYAATAFDLVLYEAIIAFLFSALLGGAASRGRRRLVVALVMASFCALAACAHLVVVATIVSDTWLVLGSPSSFLPLPIVSIAGATLGWFAFIPLRPVVPAKDRVTPPVRVEVARPALEPRIRLDPMEDDGDADEFVRSLRSLDAAQRRS